MKEEMRLDAGQSRAKAAEVSARIAVRTKEKRGKAGHSIAVCALVFVGFWNVYQTMYLAMEPEDGLLPAIIAACVSAGICVLAAYKAGRFIAESRTGKGAVHAICGFALIAASAFILSFVTVIRANAENEMGSGFPGFAQTGSASMAGIFFTVLLTLAMAVCFIVEFARGYAAGNDANDAPAMRVWKM